MISVRQVHHTIGGKSAVQRTEGHDRAASYYAEHHLQLRSHGSGSYGCLEASSKRHKGQTTVVTWSDARRSHRPGGGQSCQIYREAGLDHSQGPEYL